MKKLYPGSSLVLLLAWFIINEPDYFGSGETCDIDGNEFDFCTATCILVEDASWWAE